MKKIVIIGNGISGITAARHIRKESINPITIISSESKYFYSRTALMYIYMGHMQFKHTQPYEDFFWKKNKLDLVYEHVTGISTAKKIVKCASGKEIGYDILILATGSKPNKTDWPGRDLSGVQGLYSYQDLQLMEENTKQIQEAVIVGGGLIGIEMAEMLKSRNINVTFLIREKSFWNSVLPLEESAMINRHIQAHGVNLKFDTELKEIKADGNGRASSIITSKGEQINCQFVGLTIGVSPNIDILKNTEIECNRGILVNHYFETNIKDIYAIGDCAEFRDPLKNRKPIEQVWYTGRMQGEAAAKNVLGKGKKYQPGPWFNSAKFFDIEYQIYGEISTPAKDHEVHLYWEHGSGQKSIRIVYDKHLKNLIGINLLGIRFRHQTVNDWIQKGTSIKEVILKLKDAFFDPELYSTYQNEIIKDFNLANKTDQISLNPGKIPSAFA